MLITLGQVFLVLCSRTSNLKTNTYCVSENRSCNASVNDSCVECQPLMWFVNRTHTIPNDSTIIFLPGEHSLKSDGYEKALMNFYCKENLKLTGKVLVPNDQRSLPDLSPYSKVLCSGYAGVLFRFSSNIHIQWLTFEGCGVSSSGADISALHFFNSTNISLSHVTIKESIGFSLSIDTVCRGYVNITNSLFKKWMPSSYIVKYSDNVRIFYSHCTVNHLAPASLLLANSSILFEGGKSRGRGLLLQINQPMVTIIVTNVTIANGTAEYAGGNIEIQMLIFEVNSSRVEFRNSHIVNGSAMYGGGMYIHLIRHNGTYYCSPLQYLNAASNQISFINTTFEKNYASSHGHGGGVSVTIHGGLCFSRINITFDSCNFTHNSARTAVAMLISQVKLPSYVPHLDPQLIITLDSCTFSENYLLPYDWQTNQDGIVDLFTTDIVTIRNSLFFNNNGTALLLMDSNVLFEGEIRFLNNSAAYGGAIRVCDTSLIYLKNGTHVLFENNTAQIAGGAIYAGEHCLEKTPRCFYQPISNSTIEQLKEEMSLTFINNSASLAGDAIYGGSVDNCFTISSRYTENIDGILFKSIFHFHPNISSMVTSDPYGVCICDPSTGEPNCAVNNNTLEKFPGERFEMSLTPVGQTNGPVPAMLNVSTLKDDIAILVINKQNPSTSGQLIKCRTVSLAVFAKPGTNVTLQVSVVEANPVKEHSNYYRIPKLKAVVKMAPCPWVFQLNTTDGCDCNKIFGLTNSAIQCDINTFSIQKPGSTWFNCIDGDSTCKKLEGSSRNRHGTSRWQTFTQSNISDQCIKGRDGRLCGGCDANYSLSLGFPTCINTEENCTVWKLILLLLAFFLAGILLVCFLAIFNLTVAEGTINGLLFYANCIHANQNSFFPTEYKSSSTSFFRVFISWFNLDLGFQVCFYSGMTAYQKFWLETGFLFYLLLIGVLIVCLSHKFIWFTRLIGRNVVPVLSTLMLIAYPKLIRRSIKGFHCGNNFYWSTEKTIPLIWYEDETIDCFTGKHIPLFIFSLLMFVVAFCYTVSLLLIQCLQRGSSWRVLRWVDKLRPFFDANTGPCRDQYRFWPGLLHLIRFGVFLEATLLTVEREKILILTVVCLFMLFLVLAFPRGVYKKWPLNLLEYWVFLCLGITTALILFYPDFSKRETITNISVGISAATFMLILIHHVYKRAQKTQKCKKLASWLQNKRKLFKNDRAVVNEDTPLLEPQRIMPMVANFSALREPLLEND